MRIVHYTYPTPRSLLPALGLGGRSPWVGLESEIDRLFSSAFAARTGLNPEAGFAVDLYEDKDNHYVRAELPGVTRDAISVEMVDDNLTIQASRKQSAAEGEESSSFSRSISIPEAVQADKVGAVYENGVLTVTLPKKEEAKPKKVTVEIK
jgi:HSP20 family protein